MPQRSRGTRAGHGVSRTDRNRPVSDRHRHHARGQSGGDPAVAPPAPMARAVPHRSDSRSDRLHRGDGGCLTDSKGVSLLAGIAPPVGGESAAGDRLPDTSDAELRLPTSHLTPLQERRSARIFR